MLDVEPLFFGLKNSLGAVPTALDSALNFLVGGSLALYSLSLSLRKSERLIAWRWESR